MMIASFLIIDLYLVYVFILPQGQGTVFILPRGQGTVFILPQGQGTVFAAFVTTSKNEHKRTGTDVLY